MPLGNFQFCENWCSDIHAVIKDVMKSCQFFHSYIRCGKRSVIIDWAFLQNWRKESRTFLRTQMKLHLRVYRETVWHFEIKERPFKLCLLRQGVKVFTVSLVWIRYYISGGTFLMLAITLPFKEWNFILHNAMFPFNFYLLVNWSILRYFGLCFVPFLCFCVYVLLSNINAVFITGH